MLCSKKIAILLAAYNGEKYLSEQLDSILAQTYNDFAVYIHDDGSRDKTAEIISEYAEKYPEKIYVLDGKPTGGARNNFMYLFKEVEAEYYMCSDQDDFWLPEKVQKTLDAIEKISADKHIPCLVYTDLRVVDERLNVISDSFREYMALNCVDTSINHIIVQNVVTGCTMLLNRDLRDQMIKCRNVNNIIMHDYWAALVAAYTGKMYFLDEATMLYRQHGGNVLGAVAIGTADAFSKTGSEKIRSNLHNTRLQAKELAEVFGADKNSVISIYAGIGEKNKLARLYTYIKYRFRKSTLKKTIGLYVFG